MKIVIPMSGAGDRFVRAGYVEPKPLIRVDGRPMIEHVIEMFPGEHDYVFICNADHLRKHALEDVLRRAKPRCTIVPIQPHKLGPVFAVAQAFDAFDAEEEVIVNYCDFAVHWDYAAFLDGVRGRGADGAMTAYRGFHPHSLGQTLYAYMRHDENWLIEIREKEAFTANRMEEFASSGTYYFARGELVRRYFSELMATGPTVGGEYYVSTAYNLLQRDGLRTWIHELEHFLQWGTPSDLEEYQYWSDAFRVSHESRPVESKDGRGYNLLLMAGRGSRFSQAGYGQPKPFVPVAGVPMVARAIRTLPEARRWGVACLRDHVEQHGLRELLEPLVGTCDLEIIEHVTEGQASSALLAEPLVPPDEPLLIAACDNGMLWDRTAYRRLQDDEDVDAIVWSFSGHPALARTPKAFGWVACDGDQVTRVSVKVPLTDAPRQDRAVIGTFTFRRARMFFDAVRQMVRADRRVNGEFYIDELINVLIENGARVAAFDVDRYLGWGTPDDVRTFEYWARYFDKARPQVAEALS